MVSKKELEDILHDEEVEKNWKSIKNSKRIRKAQADEKFWREHLDPFYDEMFPHTPAKAVGDVVNREIKEYEESDPIFAKFDILEAYGTRILALMGLFWCGVGILFLIGILFYPIENSCLSC